MKKTNPHKLLSLSHHTVRLLSYDSVAHAAGGLPKQPCSCALHCPKPLSQESMCAM